MGNSEIIYRKRKVVTLCVTNHQGSVKHVWANTKKLKAIQIPNGMIEKFKFCHRGPDDPIMEFWKLYENELGFAPKK
jgi:hypothetical protein